MSSIDLSLMLVVSIALLAAAPDVRAQGKGKPAPEGQTGVKVGSSAPKFTIKDQQGAERSLDELLKRGKVAVVFFRSADW